MKKFDELPNIFQDVSHPFKGLESDHLQDKFISRELQCIVDGMDSILEPFLKDQKTPRNWKLF